MMTWWIFDLDVFDGFHIPFDIFHGLTNHFDED